MLKNPLQHLQLPEIAGRILTYLANNPEQLGRFLALTGTSPSDLRNQLHSAGLHHALLDFLMQDESLLLAFAAHDDLDPQSIALLHLRLQGGGG